MIAFVPRPPLRQLAAAVVVAALAGWSPLPARVEVHGPVLAFDPLDRTAFEHRLYVASDEGIIEVEFHGVLPDTIRDGAEVVVRGDLLAPDHVDADLVIAKCPSHYSRGQ